MQKRLFVFVPFLLSLVLIITTITPAIKMSEDISEKVFRLHILANSDSMEDQELKLKVRNKILDLSNSIYENCTSVEDAISVSKYNIKLITQTAQNVIAFYGYEYEAKSYVVKEFFNTRVYDNFTLPAGYYNTLKITIGEGKGHNWWCVMYPSVCVTGCIDDFDSDLTYNERKMIENSNYVYRFKVVEIYQKIKKASA